MPKAIHRSFSQKRRFVPLSLAQQRLWFMDQLVPASALYNIGDQLRFSEDVDGDALERAINAVVRRHEILRTSFGLVDGRAVQIISESCWIPLTVLDLSPLAYSQQYSEVRQVTNSEFQKPFDLCHCPLLRVTLL